MFGTGLRTNISILNDSDTGYVRLWVDWSVLQPYPTPLNLIRDDPNAKPLVESLDAQIVEARKNGLKVILTVIHRYPKWVVWYYGKKPLSGPCLNPCESLEGEAHETCKQSEAFKRWKKENDLKVCERMPLGLYESSPWGEFISFLVSEYGFTKDKTNPCDPAHNRYVDFLEVVNEPNLTHIPRNGKKRTDGGGLTLALDVADMFVTAQKIVRDRNAALRLPPPPSAPKLDAGATTIKLAGPATSDTMRRNQDYQEFTEELLRALDRRNFEARRGFVWTHHNYLDVEEQRNCVEGDAGCPQTSICDGYREERRIPGRRPRPRRISKLNSAAWVQKRLAEGVGGYRWGGMRDSADNPAIFLTEGGARLSQLMEIYYCKLGIPKPIKRDAEKPDDLHYIAFEQKVAAKIGDIKRKQAEVVRESFGKMSRGRLSKGILLFTNYLTYTDPINDSGMFDYAPPCGPTQERADDWYDRSGGNICTGEGGIERTLFDKWKSLRSPSTSP